MITVRSNNYFDIVRAAESQADRAARADARTDVVRVAVVDPNEDGAEGAEATRSALPSNPALGRVVNIVI